MIKCPECGNDVLEESRFCPYCMHRFTEDSNNIFGNIAFTNVSITNNKIKKYILLVTIIFICVIVVGLCVYGNVVRKTQNNNNQNNQNFVNNESNTYTSSPENIHGNGEESGEITTAEPNNDETKTSEPEQMETISKPTGSVIVPTTEQITEPTIKPTDSEKENNTVEPTKPTRPSIESSTESTTQAKEENTTESPTHVKEENTTESPTHVKEENTTEPSTEAPTQIKEESTTEEEIPSNPPTETATESNKCPHIYTNVTCTSPSVCVLCGITAYDALGHESVSASCDKDAVCGRCGVIVEEALGHNGKATCTSDGICVRCGKLVEKALGHKNAVASCSKDGICDRCGVVVEKAYGHYGNAYLCTDPVRCRECGILMKEPGEHVWDNVDMCTSYFSCRNCTFTSAPLGHDFVNKTCTSGGICSRCGKKGTNALGHNHVYNYGKCQPATCTRCGDIKAPLEECNYGNTPCYEKGTCINCGKVGVNYHNQSYKDGDYACSRCGDMPIEELSTMQVGKTIPTAEPADVWHNYSVGSEYKFDVIKDINSKYYGKTVVGIPITHDRVMNTVASNNDYTGYIHCFEPDMHRSTFVGEYFEDGLKLIVTEEEKNVTEYYYVLYNGDGEYKIVFAPLSYNVLHEFDCVVCKINIIKP